ncbi:EamA family transporter [Streptomyces xantholiticus]
MSTALPRRHMTARIPAPLLVVGSVVSIQVGQACGKHLFGAVGPLGVVFLRLALTAVVLGLVWRPALPKSWRARGLIVALGTAIAGMNVIYLAIERLDVGVAVTLQFLGPLALALIGSRRLMDFLWAVLAWIGVFLFTNPGGGSELTVSGTIFALVSGASMAIYVVLNKRAGAKTSDGSYLTYAVAWAAVLSLPTGVWEGGAELLEPWVLAAGLGVALLSAAIPYTLDMAALRRLPPRTVAVLESLEPAVAGLAATVVLGEILTAVQWVAIACVVAASIGAVCTPRKKSKG